jgi:hypothetical protein
MRRPKTSLSSLFSLVAACALTTLACGPSIDTAAKTDIDRRVAALRAPAQVYGTPTSATPMPFAVGQWVTYKFVDDKNQPSFLTLKLVGQEGAAFWYETKNESYYGNSATRMLVDFGDRRSPDSVSIKSAKLRDNKGNVTEYPEAMIGLMNSLLRGQLGPIVIDWTGLPQEDTQAAAGRFVGCYKGNSEVSFAGFKTRSVVWGHTGVPLSGMVKSQGDNNTNGELVAFGTSGATSDF